MSQQKYRFCFAVLFFTASSPKKDYTKPYLREQSSSALCCFCSDCTSARFFRKHFGCAKRYTSKQKCSVALAVNKSKSLTEGKRFRLVNYNISFAWRILFCIFLIPLFYTVPYISQSNGLLCREFIGKYRQGAAFPVVFMKLQKRSLEIKPSFVLLCLFTAECVGKINHKKYQHGYRGGFKPCKAVFCLKAAGRKDEPHKS